MAGISWSRGPCLKFIASSWIRSPRKPLSCFHGGSKDRFGWCDLSDFFSSGKLLDIDYWIVCRFIIYVDEWFFIFYQPLMLFLQNQNKKSPPLQFHPGITQIQQTSATWYLGCSFNPFEKYDRQNWIISPNRAEHKKCLKPPPSGMICVYHPSYVTRNPHVVCTTQVNHPRTKEPQDIW